MINVDAVTEEGSWEKFDAPMKNASPLVRFRVYSLMRISVGTVIFIIVGYEFGVQWLNGSSARTMVFASLLLLFLGITLLSRQLGLLISSGYLPLLGFVRRILIPISGWGSFDPLVILVPVVILLIGSFWFYKRFFLREEVVSDTTIFRLVRWFILIDILEIGNPKQGGISVGMGGIIFYIVPLFWMVLSRIYLNRIWINRIIYLLVITGTITGLYGLKQTFWGYYPFETMWINATGYTALYVNGIIRAVSTYTNAQEYATYLGVAMTAAWGFILRGKLPAKGVGLVSWGIMGYALFMESGRGPIVLTSLALAIMTVMHGSTILKKITTAVFTSLILTVLFVLLSHVQSSNGLVSHNVAGLTHPFNSQDSSVAGHSTRMYDGIITGIKMPIGYGLGSTTTAAGKFSSQNNGTEVDFSNMFVSDGIIGGVLYLVLALRIMGEAFRQAISRDAISLIVLGALISNLGQWVNGELYSTAAVTWILIGHLDRNTKPKLESRVTIVPTSVKSMRST